MENQTQSTSFPLLELDLLKTIVAIADTGNFSSAAAEVFRTPSAVSMQVKRVEEMLGRPIFTRDSRSVKPTPEGEVLVEHGRRLLALNRQILSQFIEPDVTGGVRLGSTDDIAERALPDLLRRFSQTHCCVVVDVVVGSSDALLEQVRNGELDLAIVTCSPEKKHPKDLTIVFEERLVWAGAKNGVAHEQNPVPISVWEEGCSWRNAGLESLKEQGRDYRIAFMSAYLSGQRASVLADLAIAPIPISSCVNGIVALAEREGLPSLPNYALGMVMQKKPSAAALAARDHILASFTETRDAS